jgi:hypothetical protein
MIIKLASTILAGAGIALAIAPPAIADGEAAYLKALMRAGVIPVPPEFPRTLEPGQFEQEGLPAQQMQALNRYTKLQNEMLRAGAFVCERLEDDDKISTVTTNLKSAGFSEDDALSVVVAAAQNLCPRLSANVNGF